MSSPVSIPYAATVTVPVNRGNKYFLIGPITGAMVVTFSATPETPESCTVYLILLQDGTGDRAVTFAANVYGAPVTTSDAANTYRTLEFFYEETSQSWYYTGGAVS